MSWLQPHWETLRHTAQPLPNSWPTETMWNDRFVGIICYLAIDNLNTTEYQLQLGHEEKSRWKGINYWSLPLCQAHADAFTYITLFNPDNNPMKQVLFFSPFYRWYNWRTELTWPAQGPTTCKQHSLRSAWLERLCSSLHHFAKLLTPNFPTTCFPNACEDPSVKRAQYEPQDVMSALPSVIRTKESRPLLTFPSHIIGPQFVAAITVFVLFTVELQHLGSLIKILLDPFQIVYQPIATCEERTKAAVQVWGSGEGPGVAGQMCLLFRTSLSPPEVWQGDLATKNAGRVQPLLQMALSAHSLGQSNVQTGETLAPHWLHHSPTLCSLSARPKDALAPIMKLC